MTRKIPHIISTMLICTVWFINGFFSKVLNLVPRHQQIVAQILGEAYSRSLTKVIGVAEIFIVVWILTRIKSRFCAIFQMIIVGIMNILEFTFVPDLLLFGRMNIVFAFLFIGLIYINEFVFANRKSFSN